MQYVKCNTILLCVRGPQKRVVGAETDRLGGLLLLVLTSNVLLVVEDAAGGLPRFNTR